MQGWNVAWTGGGRARRMENLVVYFAWRVVKGGIESFFLRLLLKSDVAAIKFFDIGLLCAQEGA